MNKMSLELEERKFRVESRKISSKAICNSWNLSGAFYLF